jgi:hypothetical protein
MKKGSKYTILCQDQGIMLTYLHLDDKIRDQGIRKAESWPCEGVNKDRRNDNGIVRLSLMFVCCGKEELRVRAGCED